MKDETILKNDWCKHFALTPSTPSKFYKIAGCLIIGFEFWKLRGEIQPHFVIYPLWCDDLKNCFSYPYFYHAISGPKGLKYQLSLREMLDMCDQVVDSAEKYLPFDMHENIPKDKIVELINFAQFSPVNVANPYTQGILTELKIYIATYMGDAGLYSQTLTSIDSIYPRLDKSNFAYWFGPYESWKNRLSSVFECRNEIVERVNNNSIQSEIKENVGLV